jgi:chromosome segregation ATPase
MSSFLNRIILSRKKSPSKAQTSTMKNIFKRSLANFRQSRARIHDVAIELSTPRSDTPTDTRHRTVTQRSATQGTATKRSATPTDTRHTTATQRTATPSVRTPVQQEALNKLNTISSELRALNTLTSKRNNTQKEINKINRQIHLLEQRIKGAKKAEKDEYENKITNLKASKLPLEKKLAVIERNLHSVMGTLQNNSKKGGTRKRRKYAKKH